MFPVTSALVLLSLSTLPITATLPRTLSDISQLGRELQGYASDGTSSMLHVLAVLAVVASWKHAWSVPGSVLLVRHSRPPVMLMVLPHFHQNVLAGVLLNPVLATVLMTLLTSEGSILSTLLAKPLAPLIAYLFPKALALTTAALQGNSIVISTGTDDVLASAQPSKHNQSPPWIRLSVLRLIGVVPWSGINIAAGVCSIPLWDCFLGAFLGTLPWTAVTVQVGDILMSVARAPSAATTQQTVTELLTSPAVIAKLVFLTLLSLGPILARGWLSALIGYDAEAARSAPELESSAAAEKRSEFSRSTRTRRWSAWMAAMRFPGRRSLSKQRASGAFDDELYDEEGIPLTEKVDGMSPA